MMVQFVHTRAEQREGFWDKSCTDHKPKTMIGMVNKRKSTAQGQSVQRKGRLYVTTMSDNNPCSSSGILLSTIFNSGCMQSCQIR